MKAGLAVVKAAYDMYRSEFRWKEPPYEYVFDKNPFDVIAGTSAHPQGLRERPEPGRAGGVLARRPEAFRREREKYLLY